MTKNIIDRFGHWWGRKRHHDQPPKPTCEGCRCEGPAGCTFAMACGSDRELYEPKGKNTKNICATVSLVLLLFWGSTFLSYVV